MEIMMKQCWALIFIFGVAMPPNSGVMLSTAYAPVFENLGAIIMCCHFDYAPEFGGIATDWRCPRINGPQIRGRCCQKLTVPLIEGFRVRVIF